MHVNPITNDAWKDWLVRRVRIRNFQTLIDREGIEKIYGNFWTVKNWTASIERGRDFKAQRLTILIGRGNFWSVELTIMVINFPEQAPEQSTKILDLGFDCSAWVWRCILGVTVRVWMKSKMYHFPLKCIYQNAPFLFMLYALVIKPWNGVVLWA